MQISFCISDESSGRSATDCLTALSSFYGAVVHGPGLCHHGDEVGMQQGETRAKKPSACQVLILTEGSCS